MEDLPPLVEDAFAHECQIRDMYAARLAEFRPHERLLKTENGFAGSRVRADMRTVDSSNCVYIWEFKLAASYDGLGQIQTYVALERQTSRFRRKVQGVLAAFSIQPEIRTAIDVLNLGIELVELPPKLRLAGGIPVVTSFPPVPNIPVLVGLVPTQGGSR
jgi:RecB family endonuclease NucS